MSIKRKLENKALANIEVAAIYCASILRARRDRKLFMRFRARLYAFPIAFLISVNTHAGAFTTEIDIPDTELNIGELHSIIFFMEIIAPADPFTDALEFTNFGQIVIEFKGASDPGTLIWSDIVVLPDEFGVPTVQPVGTVPRSSFTFFPEDTMSPSLPGGSFFVDNQGGADFSSAPPGETAINIFTGGLPIPFNSGGPSPVEIFIEEFQSGTSVGFHVITSASVTTVGPLVPIPPAIWLFGSGIVALMFRRCKKGLSRDVY